MNRIHRDPHTGRVTIIDDAPRDEATSDEVDGNFGPVGLDHDAAD